MTKRLSTVGRPPSKAKMPSCGDSSTRARRTERCSRAADRDGRDARRHQFALPATSGRCSRRWSRSATRLCEAEFGAVARFDGDAVASRGDQRMSPERRLANSRAVPATAGPEFCDGPSFSRREAVCNLKMSLAEPDYDARTRERAASTSGSPAPFLGSASSTRANCRGHHAQRREVRPFTDRQIALLQNFAAQAMIAMENARLMDRNARGVGAADRDRRGVAGHQFLARRSRAGVRRDTGESALRLCGVARGSLLDFTTARISARSRTHGLPDGFAEQLRRGVSGFRAIRRRDR